MVDNDTLPAQFPQGKELQVYFTRNAQSEATLSLTFQSKWSYSNWIRLNKNKIKVESMKWVNSPS